jgi:hypothetical protein
MNTLFSRISIIIILLSSSYNLFAHVKLDYPTGGETLISGTTVTVQWHITIAHVTLNWDLLYSPDGGATWEPIQMDIPKGQLSYQWLVPAGATTQARVSIIQDNEGQDYQDESTNFTIESTTSSIPTIPDFDVRIFPNPVRETLTVDLTNNTSWPVQLTLEDAYGRTLWFAREEEPMVYIPMRSFATGVYFLQMKTTQGTVTRKIIVEKL